jgi:hypothetical protein
MGAMATGVPVLRPLSVGEILDASIKVYRRNFATMAKAILVVAIPFGLISALIRASVSTSGTTISNISNPSTTSTPSASSVAANLTTYLVSLLAAAVSTAVIYRVVGSAYLGNTSSWKESVLGGLRKAHSVLWVTIMSIVGYAAIILIPVVIIVLVAARSAGFGVLAGFLLGIPAICALVWFWVISQLAIPSLMLEGYKGPKAFLRASRLVRHLWWRSFGCMLLVSLIVGVLSSVVAGVIVALLLAFSNSNLATIAVLFVSGVLTTVLFTPITASAFVVLSIDLRVRKEGYDIQLLANQLGSQPGSSALSFLPRAPLMWGGPSNGWGHPGGPWGSGPYQQGGPPAGQPGWGPAQPGWGAPAQPGHPGHPGWGPPPPAQPGWGPPAQPVHPGWGPPPPAQPGWGPPAQPGQPGWGPPPPGQPGWGTSQPGWQPPSPESRPPPPTGWERSPPPGQSMNVQAWSPGASSGWVPPGQPEPENPPPLFGQPPAAPAPPPPPPSQNPPGSAGSAGSEGQQVGE